MEEANQIGRLLPPEAFYNQLISDKMDVQVRGWEAGKGAGGRSREQSRVQASGAE